MLELDLATLLFQIVNFLILVVGLRRFLFEPLREKLNERAVVIAESRQNAHDQEVEVVRLREEWEQRREQAEKEAERIRQTARLEAGQEAEQLMEEARVRLDRLIEEMREELDGEQNEIVVQHYDSILDTIIDLSGNVIRSITTRRTHDDLVTNFCASIYQTPQEDVEEYRRLMAGRVPVAFVTTPVALTPEQTKTLADTLSSLIDRRIELQVSIDPELIVGIQVRLADKLIDNSLRQQLDHIRTRAREDLINRLGATT